MSNDADTPKTGEDLRIQPATDAEIELWWSAFEKWLRAEGIDTAPVADPQAFLNWRPGALIARVRQEQAEVATLQRLLDDERLRASEYECAGRGLQEEHDALMGELGEIRQERMDVIRERDALRAEVERLRQAMTNIQTAARQMSEKSVPSHVRNDWLLTMCEYGLKPPAPAEVQP